MWLACCPICYQILYLRRTFSALLNETGLTANVCDMDNVGGRRKAAVLDSVRQISGVNYRNSPSMTKVSTILEFYKFLQDNSPGTALDTFYGRILLNVTKKIPTTRFCQADGIMSSPVRACFLLAHSRQVPAVFNILQFAHSITECFMDSPHRPSVELLNSCWSMLEQICGRNVSYFDYQYTLISGTWDVQKITDNLTCKWQDTLIKRYIEASEDGNLWPNTYSFLGRPLFLSSGEHTLGAFANSLSELFSVIHGSIETISVRCGETAGNSINRLLRRLRYYWYDNLQWIEMLQSTQQAMICLRSSILIRYNTPSTQCVLT